MTDWKEWFAIVANLKSDNRVIGSDIESMYQAFKQRLASESPITLFPNDAIHVDSSGNLIAPPPFDRVPLDCQGVTDNKGKTDI